MLIRIFTRRLRQTSAARPTSWLSFRQLRDQVRNRIASFQISYDGHPPRRGWVAM